LKIIRKRKYLQKELKVLRTKPIDIGFVPTMGSLHKGHISLIKNSKRDNDITICSIYVNPKQFNDKNDLINYPKDEIGDIRKLEQANCDILFLPSDEEMYPSEFQNIEYGFTTALNVLEGQRRPGHFNGVLNVIKILFELVKPSKAYFGEKDYQQLWLIVFFQKLYNFSPIIIAVNTIRDENGLALSSRNQHLSLDHKKISTNLYAALTFFKENIEDCFKEPSSLYIKSSQVQRIRSLAIRDILSNPSIKLDYFEIIELENFSFVSNLHRNKKYRVLIAAYVGKIRLIDNISIN